MRAKLKTGLRFMLSALFASAGVMHFAKPEIFVKIVPSALPFPEALVYISGVFEILAAIALLVRRSRKLAGIGLGMLLLAVFPANVNMAVNSIDFGLPHELLWWRLPLQFALIAAVWWVSHPWKVTRAPIEKPAQF